MLADVVLSNGDVTLGTVLTVALIVLVVVGIVYLARRA